MIEIALQEVARPWDAESTRAFLTMNAWAADAALLTREAIGIDLMEELGTLRGL